MLDIGFVLDEKKREALRSVKANIKAMLKERNEIESKKRSMALPSDYWSDFCSFFSYMLDLSEESLTKICLHTYHITGNTYQNYYFRIGEQSLLADFACVIEGLPKEYVVSEPEGSIGFRTTDGRLINGDTYRAQLALNAIMGAGLRPDEVRNSPRKLFFEIGAGYGSTAYHLSQVYKNVTYIILDLPETLIFSGCYLSMLNPDRTYIYTPEEPLDQILQPARLAQYDFVLIPNYQLDALKTLQFDAVINVASLQEMRSDQVEEYLDAIQKTCKGFFYCYNQDHQPRNSELRNLTELLKARFDVQDVGIPARQQAQRNIRVQIRKRLRQVAIAMGLANRQEMDLPYRPYICKSRNWVTSNGSFS